MIGRISFLLSCVFYLGLWIWAWIALPSHGVVHHMGTDGMATRTGSRVGLLLPLLGIAVLIGLCVVWLPSWLTRRFPEAVNYPHKEYWFAPQRKEQTLRRLSAQMALFGAATMLLLAGGLYEGVRQTLDPGSTTTFWWLMGAFLIFTVIWTVWLIMSARLPHDARSEGP